MSRQSRARWLAGATAAVVVGLSVLFAIARNPGGTLPAPVAAPAAADAATAAGRAAFERVNCPPCSPIWPA